MHDSICIAIGDLLELFEVLLMHCYAVLTACLLADAELVVEAADLFLEAVSDLNHWLSFVTDDLR